MIGSFGDSEVEGPAAPRKHPPVKAPQKYLEREARKRYEYQTPRQRLLGY
jgi:hypothetical protein